MLMSSVHFILLIWTGVGGCGPVKRGCVMTSFTFIALITVGWKSPQVWSEMTLNYRVTVEGYPNLKEEVGSSNPGYEISSRLDGKLARWWTASCALALACWPFISKKKKVTIGVEYHNPMYFTTLHIRCLLSYSILCHCGNFSKDTSYEKVLHKYLHFAFIQMPIIETKIGVLCILAFLSWNFVMVKLKVGWKSTLVSDNNRNIVNLQCLNFFLQRLTI